MNVSNCIDSAIELKSKSLDAATIEEMELLRSVAALLYKTKSVRKTINILDNLVSQKYQFGESIPYSHSSNL